MSRDESVGFSWALLSKKYSLMSTKLCDQLTIKKSLSCGKKRLVDEGSRIAEGNNLYASWVKRIILAKRDDYLRLLHSSYFHQQVPRKYLFRFPSRPALQGTRL